MKKGLHKSKKVCYDNPRWVICAFGPVAQLGERTVRIRKVVGSNPFRSTKQVLDEHLFLQWRLRRKGFALIRTEKRHLR